MILEMNDKETESLFYPLLTVFYKNKLKCFICWLIMPIKIILYWNWIKKNENNSYPL